MRAELPVCQITVYLAFSNLKNFQLNWFKLKFAGMEPRVLNCCYGIPKCAKTQLRASAIPKNFRGLYPRTPVKGGKEGFWGVRRDRNRRGRKDIRDGR
jgi:hypothetical protein